MSPDPSPSTDFPHVVQLFNNRELSADAFKGCGVLFGSQHVLTCHHVVKDLAKIGTDDDWFAKDADGTVLKVSRQRIVSTDKPDLALMEIEKEGVDGQARERSQTGLSMLMGLTDQFIEMNLNHKRFYAIGGSTSCSTIAWCTDRYGRLMKPPGPQIHEIYDNVQCEGGIPDGFSGGPVLVHHDAQWVCIGINWLGRDESGNSRFLTADSIHRFLNNHRPELIGISAIRFVDLQSQHGENEDTQRKLIQAAVELLATSEKGLDTVTHQLPVDRQIAVSQVPDLKERSRAVVNELLHLPSVPEILEKIVYAMKELDRSRSKADADIIEHVAYFLIPASLTKSLLQQLTVTMSSPAGVLQMFAKTETFVELAMARLGGRKALFNPISKPRESPAGKLCVPAPPDTTIDHDHGVFIQRFVEHFTGLYPKKFVFEEQSTNVMLINHKMVKELRKYKWQYYYVFVYPKGADERARWTERSEKLSKTFPSLKVIGLTSGTSDSIFLDEFDIIDEMAEIFCRASKIEYTPYAPDDQ